jgi:hypothetical protein
VHKYTQNPGQQCPVLINFLVGIRLHDAEQKRIKNALRQRQRRLDYKLNGPQKSEPAAATPWLVLEDGHATRLAVQQAAPAGATSFQVEVAPSAPVNRAKVRYVLAELAEACEPVELKLKPKKRGRPTSKKSGELPLDTLDVTPPPPGGLAKLEKLRVQCRETARLLIARDELKSVLFKAGSKILNCSLWGLFHVLSPEVNYKVGTALCKCRLCPNCQRVLAAKRRQLFLDWFELNREAVKPYFFYHLVLTVKHKASEGVRTNLYTPDLLKYFAQLRGTYTKMSGRQRRQRSADWKHFVAGGAYSVEVKQGRDKTPNIHIHCLLVGKVLLHNRKEDSEFMLHVKEAWKEITKDSDNVFIEPVYYIDKESGKKTPAFRGSDANVERAVAECMKYTIKADAASLADYSDSFLTDLLTFRNRYYSRFGCLSSNDKSSKQFARMDMLCIDYQDLEQVTKQELARLINPETGEIVEADNTQFVATPLRNMKPVAPHQPAPAKEVRSRMVPTGKLWPQDGSALAGTPVLAPVVEAVPQASADEARINAPELYYSAVSLPDYLAVAQYKFFPHHEKQRAAIWLSRSISADYDAKLELDATQATAPRVQKGGRRAPAAKGRSKK